MSKCPIAFPVARMDTQSFESGEAFMAQFRDLAATIAERQERELQLANAAYPKPVSYAGHCGICNRDATYTCDFAIFRELPDGRKEPAWRERLLCPCGLSNRIRAALHFMLDTAGMKPDSRIYLTEQTTPLFAFMKDHFKNLVGSEYLGDPAAPDSAPGSSGAGEPSVPLITRVKRQIKKLVRGSPRGGKVPFGMTSLSGIRNEDITKLTFADNTFDVVGSFEVLEHVPDYKAGLKEMCRVLKPGGHLVASFPFRPDLMETLVRAKIGDKGDVVHLLEPEYHGDPINQNGVLCFYHFGWDILTAMREAGFSQARCHYYWSWENGYLGGALPQFHAIK